MTHPDFHVAVIGAGPGGITCGHLLRRRGITDFVILERGDDFGGTWRDNHYPGLAVDIPSLWYQFPFAPNRNWTRFFAPGPEINRYLRDTARTLNLYPHLRTGCEVTRQVWDDAESLWRLELADGAEITARFVISAVGGYVNAKPQVDIDGLADFRGDVLRPNDWDDSYDVTGKRVAVIGTGSSGVQIAAALSDSVASLDVYQRTPAWVLPKVDFDIPPVMRTIFRVPGSVRAVNALGRWSMDAAMLAPLFHVFNRLPDRMLVAAMPFYDRWSRFLYRLLLRATVDDPATRRALLPRYGIMAKRPVISSTFLPAFNRPSTRLITTPIRRITRTGVETADGVAASGRPDRHRHRLRAVDRSRDLSAGNGAGAQRIRPRRRLPGERPASLRRDVPSAAAQPVGARRARWASSASRGSTSSRPWPPMRCASSPRRADAGPKWPRSAKPRSPNGTPRCGAGAGSCICISPRATRD